MVIGHVLCAVVVGAWLGPDIRAQGPLTVSGQVVHAVLNSGLGGVTLNGFPASVPVQTQPDGSFSTSVPLGWSGTVTPSRPGFAFSPPTLVYTNLAQSQTNQAFSASPTTPPTHFFVDGASGNNANDGLTPATAWATLTHACSTLRIAGHGHTLHVAGGQSYGPSETFPLVLPPGITLQGDGVLPPTLVVPAGSTCMRSDSSPTGVQERVDQVRRLQFVGGAVAIAATMSGRAHGVAVESCRFAGLGTGLHCDNTGISGAPPFQPFVAVRDSVFDGVGNGIDADVDRYGWWWLFTVDRCEFRNVTGIAVRSAVGWRDTDNPLVVADCAFVDVGTGVEALGGYSLPSGSRPRVVNCRFTRCTSAGVRVFAGGDSLNGFLVESCGFTGCGRGVDLTLAGSNPLLGGYHIHTVRDCVFLACGIGLAATFQQSFADGLVLERNRYEGCGTGADVATNQIVRVQSTREVYLDNTLGVRLHGQGGGSYGSTAWEFVLRDGILARNSLGGCRLDAQGAIVVCRGLTVADNGTFGIALGAVDPASRIDHCVFDNPGPAIVAATPIPVTWSCFANQTVAGVGNQNADPRLVRPYFKLAPSSPCRDAGDPSASLGPTDYEGDARVVGTASDVGADEYTPAGTVRPFGLRGLGRGGMSPSIASPNATAPIGGSLAIDLAGAAPGTAALLFMGTGERAVPLRDLEVLGAPGSFVWIDPLGALTLAPVGGGTAQFVLGLPANASLIGGVATFQWLVFAPGANAAGLVTTQGMRATIGV